MTPSRPRGKALPPQTYDVVRRNKGGAPNGAPPVSGRVAASPYPFDSSLITAIATETSRSSSSSATFGRSVSAHMWSSLLV